MSFHTNVRQMIEIYGSEVTIQRNEKLTKSKAFIQPLRYKTGVYNDKTVALGGFTDGRYYLYIGQADNEFSRTDNAIISCNGKKYVVHTSETFEFLDKVLYVWAVLAPYKEQRRDDYETD